MTLCMCPMLSLTFLLEPFHKASKVSHFLPGHLFCQRAYVLRSVRWRYCFTYPRLPCGSGGGCSCVPPETTPLRAGGAEKGLPVATTLIQALGSCPPPPVASPYLTLQRRLTQQTGRAHNVRLIKEDGSPCLLPRRKSHPLR